jgi:hypothetical protein
MVAVEIVRDQAFRGRDGHGRVCQRLDEWREDITRRDRIRLQHDHHLAGRPAQGGLEGIASSERQGRPDGVIERTFGRRVRAMDDDHLCKARRRRGDRFEAARGIRRFVQHDDDADLGRRRLLQTGWHRFDRAVERSLACDDVGWTSWLELVGHAEVDDLPAGRLDARLELVGGAVVPLGAGSRPLVRQRDDLVRY